MNKIKLGNILDVKRGTSLSGEYYSDKGNKIRLTLGNFNYPSSGFKKNITKTNIYFTGKVKSEFILKKGDIITPLTEQVAGLLGETARIPEDNTYIQSGDIGLIIPNEKILDKSFTYYLVASPTVKKQLGAGAQQTKIRHTSPDKIKDCEVYLLDIKDQKNIGFLLDTINSKIELNNKINYELEQIAKTLYDYWFVQFDFPDKNGKPYKTSGGSMVYNEELKREIPEGWEVKRLGEVCDIYQPQTISDKDCIENGEYFVHGSNGIIGKYDKYNHEESEIIVSCRGDCGNIHRTLPKVWITGNAMVFKMKNKTIHNEFLYQSLNYSGIKNISSGSVQGQITRTNVSPLKIIIPEKNIINKFSEISESIVTKKLLIQEENQKLSELRDWLLPMLMNGQVKVK